MMKLSRIGAAALAVALSFTLLTPVGVKAEQWHDYNKGAGTVIDKYEKTITVTGTDNGDGTAGGWNANKAELAAWNNAVAQGIAVAGTETSWNKRIDVIDTSVTPAKTIHNYFKYASGGYTSTSTNDPAADNKSTTCILKFTYTEYKNTITGEMAYNEDDLSGGNRLTETPNYIDSKITVHTGDFDDIGILLDGGNVEIRNIKSSNKKVVQARLGDTWVNKTTKIKDINKDDKGFYYVANNGSGENIYVPSADTKVNASSAIISIRVFGKKVGKAVISFDIYDVNGTKTGSAKVTVVSTKDKAIESITFAGKSLEQGDTIGKTDNKYIYKGKDINTFYEYTTKKAGKLKVKTGKNYNLVRIQVGVLEKYKWDSSMDPHYGEDNYSTADATYSKTKAIETTGAHPVDLNGDGDYDDTIDGMRESAVMFRYKTVKNNKKITLGKLPDYTNQTDIDSETYNNANANQNKSESSIINSQNAANRAPTRIKVTVYNKIDKKYEDYEYEIYKRIKKY
ncbi:hypothetical protein [Butyrivibrio sp. INlla16]|uniref:hypothetical protein n=1 Tax=Butyrivibrio sp. INlla16 TaxID=1520807 RepID=UPI000883D433|nr:hypothetical protein [Butyrivibrio sp. INlla16]SDB41340.1 hypothetical protein SAMN02910263_01995 [Butyrivibrio sp. INlla16]